MNYYLSEENFATLSMLSQLADDERGPSTGPGRGGSSNNPPPPGGTNPPPRKKLPAPGKAQQLSPKGGSQQPPPRVGKWNPENVPEIPNDWNPKKWNIGFPPQPSPEKKINPLLLYGAGALALYFLFFKK
jgi:hypothetical protein